jgi:hypothetical protein
MKRILLSISLLLLVIFANAQNGLEGIIVEKYYVSNSVDQTAADDDLSSSSYPIGTLPVGSVTYRVYADLLSGYNLQATFGIPTHELKVTTSTQFYNNSFGSTSPVFNRNSVKNTTGNVLGLDSYWSMGTAASNANGILKSEDDAVAGGINLITLVSGSVLQNADLTALPALTTQDGYYYPIGSLYSAATFTPGMNLEMLNDGSTVGNSFSTFDGSIYVTGGTTGPTASNKILLGQFTTDGIFSFELNLQVGGPGGIVQQFVAKNATGSEILNTSLKYTTAPPANIINSFSVNNTTCGLANGSIISSQSGGVIPYTYSWNNGATTKNLNNVTAGSYILTVTDDNGNSTTDTAEVIASLCPKVTSQTVSSITQNSALVTWPAVPCANKYQVVIKQVGTLTQTVFLVNAPTTTYTLTSLLAGKSYQVRVRTVCSADGNTYSDLSPISSFNTLPATGSNCLTPTNISSSNITSNSANINWTSASGAIQYFVRYRIVGSLNWLVKSINNPSAVTILLNNLTPASTYEYQVRSKCSNSPNVFSAYSSVKNFNTLNLRGEEIYQSAFDVSLYPNPADNNINLNINLYNDAEVSIAIIDVIGHLVLTDKVILQAGNQILNYSIYNLPKGLYLVHIQSGNESRVIKLLK